MIPIENYFLVSCALSQNMRRARRKRSNSKDARMDREELQELQRRTEHEAIWRGVERMLQTERRGPAVVVSLDSHRAALQDSELQLCAARLGCL